MTRSSTGPLAALVCMGGLFLSGTVQAGERERKVFANRAAAQQLQAFPMQIGMVQTKTFHRLFPAPPAVPWSRDAEQRRRQAIDRQLSVLDYVHRQADPWLWQRPAPEAWMVGFRSIWGVPSYAGVESSLGYRRIYDGRGGYSYRSIYLDELVQPPLQDPNPPQKVPQEAVRLFSW